jgi:cytochrome P450
MTSSVRANQDHLAKTTFDTDQFGPLPLFLRDGLADIELVTASDDGQVWLVRDYALGRTVLSDKRFSRAEAMNPHVPKITGAEPAAESMMSMDGADHARLRRSVAAAFSRQKVTALAPHVEQLVDARLDRMAAAGPPADLISGLAAPVSLAVLCAVLGIPVEDHEKFADLVEVLFDISRSTAEQKFRQRLKLVGYMTELISDKRARHDDDLLTALIELHEDDALSQGEMITLGLTLLMAGYETTAGQIGLGVQWLLSDPKAWQRLRDHPDSLAATAEELLRLTPSTPLSFPRVAVEPVSLGPVTIDKGAAVIVSLLHSNHDAKVFAQPALLQPEGRKSVYLTFGHGLHRCLGAALAQLQVQTVLARLIRRFPDLRLAPGPDPVTWKEGLAIRGHTRLFVEW